MTAYDPAEVRRFAAAVFGRSDETPDVPVKDKKPNTVLREGTNSPLPPDRDEEVREFVSELFFGYFDG